MNVVFDLDALDTRLAKREWSFLSIRLDGAVARTFGRKFFVNFDRFRSSGPPTVVAHHVRVSPEHRVDAIAAADDIRRRWLL